MSPDHLLMLFRPLLTVSEAAWLMGNRSVRSVSAKLESGSLRGLDISEESERGRREMRIYRYSVEHLLLYPQRPLDRPPVELILPHLRTGFRPDEVAQLLNCSRRHVARLAFPQRAITRKEFIAFLRSREVQA